MLRAITFPMFGLDAKFWGVVVMGAAIAILFVLPWLDRSAVRSIRYKGNPLEVDARTIFDLFCDAWNFGRTSVNATTYSTCPVGNRDLLPLFPRNAMVYPLWESTEVVPKRVTK